MSLGRERHQEVDDGERESGRVAGASLIYRLPQPRGRPLSEMTPAKRQHIAYSEP